MPRIPYRMAVPGLSSVFSFPTFTLPAYSLARASIVGPMALQGPHQGAQKSTSTGVSDFSTSWSKAPSVKVSVFSAAMFPSIPAGSATYDAGSGPQDATQHETGRCKAAILLPAMAEFEIKTEGGGSDPLGQKVGVLAAVLAVGLAVVSIASHRAHTTAVLLKTEANDRWSFYQSKRIKLHSLELGEQLVT